MSTLNSMMTDLKDEGVMLILRLMELVIKAFPAEGPHVFMPLMPRLFSAMMEQEVWPSFSSFMLNHIICLIRETQW